MNRTMFTKVAAAAVLTLGATAPFATASAQSPQVLNFTGSANLSNQPGSGGANLLIDFLTGTPEPSVAGTATGTVTAVPTVSPVFAGITINPATNGTIQDLVVSSTGVVGTGGAGGMTNPGSAPPIPNFLTIGGYTFSLTSAGTGNTFGPISLFEDPGFGTTARFGVRGAVTGPNIAAGTTYTGVFTAQFAGLTAAQVFNQINSSTGFNSKSFSAEFALVAPNVVPEPSTYALLGTGIAALGLTFRRRRNTTKA